MEISFSLSEEYRFYGREHTYQISLDDVSKTDLRWYYFLGRLGIAQSGLNIGPSWTWIPWFDAMYSVLDVMVFAQGGDDIGRIDFTENDEFITFDLEGEVLNITASYTAVELRCSVKEFVTAGRNFIRSSIRQVVAAYPALGKNAAVHDLALDVGMNIPVD
jgi:hypothetical protein